VAGKLVTDPDFNNLKKPTLERASSPTLPKKQPTDTSLVQSRFMIAQTSLVRQNELKHKVREPEPDATPIFNPTVNTTGALSPSNGQTIMSRKIFKPIELSNFKSPI
jgi:hypothetical protein